jgi:RNA polymerase sigma-70 factor (ECF subfamily)
MEWMEGPDDAELSRARAGDAEAFRVLVERHARGVFRLAFRMLGNEEDAEDVVQETFLKAWSRLHQFEARSAFGPWLRRIAANCAYDTLRRRKRTPLAAGPWTDDEGDQVDPLQALPSPTPSAEREVWGAQLRARLGSALHRLSPLERAAFTLRHLEERPIAEIARTLGCDDNNAKQSVFRAVRKLRRALSPAFPVTP